MIHIDPIEQHLFFEGIFLRYGFDFRQYAEASLKRRLEVVLRKFSSPSPLHLLTILLNDKELFYQALSLLTTPTTEFFRDPEFFKSIRQNVIPIFRTYPTLNIWLAGCSTGEEAYSMAILLKEENLYNRCTLFATDISPQSLKTARDGIYDLESMQAFVKNYVAAGGTESPSDYYTADYGHVRFDPSLRENIVFSEHNLVTDEVFTEAHMILCRNVMIYFSRELRDRALKLFSESLVHKGILGLGSKETVRFSKSEDRFEALDGENKIFQHLPRIAGVSMHG